MTDHRPLPKIELHVHIEGAAPPDFIRMLAAEQNVDLSGIFNADGSYRWSDFAEFLRTYEAASSVLKGPDEYRRLTEAVLAKSAADGVIYTELFLAPDISGGGDPVSWREHLAAIDQGAQNALDAHGIDCRFIATAVRHFGPDTARKAAELSVAEMGGRLTGWGMGGEERHLTAADFAPAFGIAREAGLSLTSHAGEICGADSVRDTLDHLRPARIGHGVRSVEDPDLVTRIAGEGIVLEVNPGSNISLSVFPTWADHPIDRLRNAGCKVTVSTDDPPYFHTDMVAEYDGLAETFGWTPADFADVNRVALAAAFCDEGTRARLSARLEEGYANA